MPVLPDDITQCLLSSLTASVVFGSIIVSVIGTLILLAILRSSRKHLRESDERPRSHISPFFRSVIHPGI